MSVPIVVAFSVIYLSAKTTDAIVKLRGRIGELVDEMSTLKSEINTFRTRITSDMKLLFENTKRIK